MSLQRHQNQTGQMFGVARQITRPLAAIHLTTMVLLMVQLMVQHMVLVLAMVKRAITKAMDTYQARPCTCTTTSVGWLTSWFWVPLIITTMVAILMSRLAIPIVLILWLLGCITIKWRKRVGVEVEADVISATTACSEESASASLESNDMGSCTDVSIAARVSRFNLVDGHACNNCFGVPVSIGCQRNVDNALNQPLLSLKSEVLHTLSTYQPLLVGVP
ncbi:hypothetical protein GQ42DRAFT_36221 [Ramicandelaber brevisporus]|nr:hypothetical protein GQ42DRAFT_36221 [Ramicandelaber brevisporus]